MIVIDRILIDLAKNGPAVGYQVAKRSKIVRASTYNGLKQLLEQGCVESHPVPECKGFLKKKEYHLTILGLSRSLTLTSSDEWDPIIERWGHLLQLVLGKWDIFVSAGVEKTAWRNLTLAAGLVSETKFPPFKWGPSRDWNTIDKFYYYFYQIQFGLDDHKDNVRWVKACAKDSDVSDYLARQLTLMVKQHEVWLKEEKAMLQILRKR